MECAVYWCYNRRRELIYIGMSSQPLRRLYEHDNSRSWLPKCVKLTLVWYATRTHAKIAEREAIKQHKPRYNVSHARPAVIFKSAEDNAKDREKRMQWLLNSWAAGK